MHLERAIFISCILGWGLNREAAAKNASKGEEGGGGIEYHKSKTRLSSHNDRIRLRKYVHWSLSLKHLAFLIISTQKSTYICILMLHYTNYNMEIYTRTIKLNLTCYQAFFFFFWKSGCFWRKKTIGVTSELWLGFFQTQPLNGNRWRLPFTLFTKTTWLTSSW